jgi:Peptidase family S41
VGDEAPGMRWLQGLFIEVVAAAAVAAGAETAPFSEVFDLVRTHAAGIDADSLNRAALDGLVGKLGGQVRLKPTGTNSPTAASKESLRLFEGRIGYWHPADFDAEGADSARRFNDFAASNHCAGWVLDLRGVGGSNLSGAADVADIFTPPGRPVLDLGQGMRAASPKTNLPTPLAVLINGETRGAADAVAAALHANESGILIGGPTGGGAARFEEFKLSNGGAIEIATSQIKVGGDKTVPVSGQKPDISVSVSAAAEKSWLEDPFAGPDPFIQPRRRMTEAELVREKRGGPAPTNNIAPATHPRSVRDPVLLRALDFLKGVEILRPASN